MVAASNLGRSGQRLAARGSPVAGAIQRFAAQGSRIMAEKIADQSPAASPFICRPLETLAIPAQGKRSPSAEDHASFAGSVDAVLAANVDQQIVEGVRTKEIVVRFLNGQGWNDDWHRALVVRFVRDHFKALKSRPWTQTEEALMLEAMAANPDAEQVAEVLVDRKELTCRNKSAVKKRARELAQAQALVQVEAEGEGEA
jgi:hypothetical protein